jgi:hypothetical protein
LEPIGNGARCATINSSTNTQAVGISIDASRQVPTAAENRGCNTAYPPRIHV